ncbi:hypothetical protein [Paludibacterium denitrificans]|uniref:hypothetical protein n=1 Tax=Paludibacterium denitrificans TaxID=2675226 RepID=UPI0035E42D6A
MSNENGMAPGQIIKVLVGVVVFLGVAIFLLVKLATSGYNVDAEVMTKEAVASRLKPVGESKASDAPPGMRTGEQVFKAICISCHGAYRLVRRNLVTLVPGARVLPRAGIC